MATTYTTNYNIAKPGISDPGWGATLNGGLDTIDTAIKARADDLVTHAGAADPHAGYQKESEKGQINGYPELDSGGKIPAARMDRLNGSFELDTDSDGTPDGWTAGVYTGGTKSLEATGGIDGTKCMKFTHPGGSGNGGGWMQSDYIPVSALVGNILSFGYYATAAGMKVIVEATFYDYAQSSLGTLTLYSSTSNPTQWALAAITNIMLYSTSARWVKIKLIGGYTDTDVAGSVYFDDARIGLAAPSRQQTRLSETIDFSCPGASNESYGDTGGPYSITIPSWAKWLLVPFYFTTTNTNNVMKARTRIGTTYSTEVSVPGIGYGTAVTDVSALSGARSLYIQTYYVKVDGTYSAYSTAASQQKAYQHLLRTVDYAQARVTDS